MADATVIQEMQLEASESVSSGIGTHSRVLTVYNVEVMDFDFTDRRFPKRHGSPQSGHKASDREPENRRPR